MGHGRTGRVGFKLLRGKFIAVYPPTSTTVNAVGRATASSRCEQSPSPTGMKVNDGAMLSRIATRRVVRVDPRRARARAWTVALRVPNVLLSNASPSTQAVRSVHTWAQGGAGVTTSHRGHGSERSIMCACSRVFTNHEGHHGKHAELHVSTTGP